MNHKLHAENCLEKVNVMLLCNGRHAKCLVSHRARTPQVIKQELQENRGNYK